MELRHLRCFVVLGEELNFTHAAERLHIEQSPLSRTIKELEEDLGVVLFDRNRMGTRLTAAGSVYLDEVRRVLALLEQAGENVRAIATGYRGSLRIAISDGAIDPRLSEILARFREDAPEIEIRICEVPLQEQLRGLRAGDFRAGFAHTANVGDGICAEPVWRDTLLAAIPTHHPLLAYKEIPLEELARYPLVMCDPQTYEGCSRELTLLLRTLEQDLKVVEHVRSSDMMLTLVSAGYGVGFTSTTRMALCKHPDIVVRPLASESAVLTTYLLHLAGNEPCVALQQFLTYLHAHPDS
ncbi:LysR family transcriptional regulator [Pseudoxanthomonas mexicana]|uniref:LysR family transcriptional regulator n=1 Tax=Pseudoxanthomonas mexicana TaxID=128785 RepID=UPI00398A8C77